MTQVRFLFLSAVFISHFLSAQIPSVTIKIREKSGFLGMGGPRFIELRLGNQTIEYPLNDVNVNSGPSYFFLCKPAGNWLFDEDFIDDDLPNLTLVQGDLSFPVEWNGPFAEGDSSLQIGFSKQLRIHEPITVRFASGDTQDEAEMKIPQELWPGFVAFTRLSGRVDGEVTGGRHREVIPLCEQILREKSFSIYPTYDRFREIRIRSFRTIYTQTWIDISGVVDDQQADLKTKIARLDETRPLIQFVVDSLPAPVLGITDEDSSVSEILSRALTTLEWFGTTRASLQQALDDQNVRWILEGSVSGRSGFRYQTMLEALAYAFSSLDFADTSAAHLECTIPEEMRGNLEKNGLTDSYETFLRQTNERYQKGLPLFSGTFLENVRRDTASFRLPFSSMLAAVNAYYDRSFEGAQTEIFNIFRMSYDPEVSARFDQMRIMIKVRQGEFSREALNLLEEAAELERSDPEAAGEKYRQATLVAPNFAYASFALGQYYGRSGDPIRAQTFFERSYDSDTLYLSAYRESFNLYRRVGNYKPMIEVLTRALRKGNDYWETQSNLGLAYMGDGDPARAIQHYEHALAINPRSYTTNIQLGLAYQTVKNYQKAREFFNNAINIDPLRQEAVEYLGRLNELQRGGK
ncbi:MAG: tetratricopeptide repeat protein [Ignavibacteriales bacterium]|nr:tetratricopeptide repeat protein [Ignavibacteriales bacterium]